MNAEEQLERARTYREHLAKTDRRRTIMMTIALTGAMVVSMLFLLYAFVQKSRADAQHKECNRLMTEALSAHEEMLNLKAELEACKSK
jgi:hypothetical protein